MKNINNRIIKKLSTGLATFAILASTSVLPTFAQSNSTQVFSDTITPLNNSGVHGHALLVLNGDQLNVRLYASGLEPGKEHLQHIHGKIDGSNSVCPTTSADTDLDGTTDLVEGLPFYGPILQGLTPFPTTMVEVYNQTFTVNASDPMKNVLPLENRVIVLHGMTVSSGQDKSFNNGGAGYDTTLPIACGHISKALRSTGNGLGNGLGFLNAHGFSVGILGNGAGSINGLNVRTSNTSSVVQRNDSIVTNNVNSRVQTGGNQASFTTGSETMINSSDALNQTTITNSGNTNMLQH